MASSSFPPLQAYHLQKWPVDSRTPTGVTSSLLQRESETCLSACVLHIRTGATEASSCSQVSYPQSQTMDGDPTDGPPTPLAGPTPAAARDNKDQGTANFLWDQSLFIHFPSTRFVIVRHVGLSSSLAPRAPGGGHSSDSGGASGDCPLLRVQAQRDLRGLDRRSATRLQNDTFSSSSRGSRASSSARSEGLKGSSFRRLGTDSGGPCPVDSLKQRSIRACRKSAYCDWMR